MRTKHYTASRVEQVKAARQASEEQAAARLHHLYSLVHDFGLTIWRSSPNHLEVKLVRPDGASLRYWTNSRVAAIGNKYRTDVEPRAAIDWLVNHQR